MEYSATKCGIYHNAPHPPTSLFNNTLKLETPDYDDIGFCMDNNFSSSSRTFNLIQQDQFHHLDHHDFDHVIDAQSYAVDDPFDPFSNTISSSNSVFDFFEFKPCSNEGNYAMQSTNFHGEGIFLDFPNTKDMLMMETETSFLNFRDNDIPKPHLGFLVPDESSSCVTADNFGMKRNRNIGNQKNKKNSNGSVLVSTKTADLGRKKSKSSKGQWTIEEDRMLIHLVEKYGVRKWSRIAQTLKGRIGKQCRERWHNHLRPDIKKDQWTEEEDRVLIEAHGEIGNKWAEIAKRLPGRTENSIKNHWNATKRRQFSRRKCRTKWPRPSSLLQNYIKSLNFDNSSSNKSSTSARNNNPIAPIDDPPNSTNHGLVLDNMSLNDVMEEGFVVQNDNREVQEFDDVADFDFDEDHMSIGSFMDDIRVDEQVDDIGDEPCFDLELPFDDMPPLMM